MRHKFYVVGGVNLKILSIIFETKKSLKEITKATKLEESTIRAALSCMVRRKEVNKSGKRYQRRYKATRPKTQKQCIRCDGEKLVGMKTIVCLNCGMITDGEKFKITATDPAFNFYEPKKPEEKSEAMETVVQGLIKIPKTKFNKIKSPTQNYSKVKRIVKEMRETRT